VRDALPLILGIETSCDETAAAVLAGPRRVRSSVVASQHELHEAFAGVVPEIASRAHLERIGPVVLEAIARAGVAWGDIAAVAVGNRPGLIGSLIVGVSGAKAIAWSLGVPVIGVDHVDAHLHAPLLFEVGAAEPPMPRFPALGLVVSGGHTSLYLCRSVLERDVIGRTIDDAAGEAFDKAATILGLAHPGGPKIDALAQSGDDRAHDYPVAALGRDRLDFSFSGLKTALLYAVRGVPVPHEALQHVRRDVAKLTERERADHAASFQRAAVAAVMRNVSRALDRFDVHALLVGGGVSANSRLRAELEELARRRGLDLRLSPWHYCIDNAAMIAGAGAARYERGDVDDLALSASARRDRVAGGRSLRPDSPSHGVHS
jgi:N6-L-threonylcarbamoyladenine synthase